MAVKSSNKPAKSTRKAASKGTAKFSKETYVKWYKDMLMIRKFEEKTGQLYIQQKFGGFCHLYIGQEAIVVGTASVGGLVGISDNPFTINNSYSLGPVNGTSYVGGLVGNDVGGDATLDNSYWVDIVDDDAVNCIGDGTDPVGCDSVAP